MTIDKINATPVRILRTLATMAIATMCLAQVALASNAAEIASAITAKGLTTTTSGNSTNGYTVLVTGTKTAAVADDTTSYLTLDIDTNVAVIWRAQLTGNPSGNYALIDISGFGVFRVESGSIGNTGTGRAINNNSTGTLIILGGTISAQGSGFAIYNQSSAVLALGGNPTITGRIFAYPEKLRTLVTANVFAPGTKIYTLDFPQYAASNVAVVNGNNFVRNFVLHNTRYALNVSGVHLAMASAYKVSFNLNGGAGIAPTLLAWCIVAKWHICVARYNALSQMV